MPLIGWFKLPLKSDFLFAAPGRRPRIWTVAGRSCHIAPPDPPLGIGYRRGDLLMQAAVHGGLCAMHTHISMQDI